MTNNITLPRGRKAHVATAGPVRTPQLRAITSNHIQWQHNGRLRCLSHSRARMQIESAYDILLMQNMRARMSGQMNVKNSVRFADVPSKKTAQQVPAPPPPCSRSLPVRAAVPRAPGCSVAPFWRLRTDLCVKTHANLIVHTLLHCSPSRSRLRTLHRQAHTRALNYP